VKGPFVLNEAAWLRAFFFALLCTVAPGCMAETDGVGSETNWLTVCLDDDECGVGACHCGVCTRVCSNDEQCDAIGSSECISPRRLGSCERVPEEPICATEGALRNANPGFEFGKSSTPKEDAGTASNGQATDDDAGDSPLVDSGVLPVLDESSGGEPEPNDTSTVVEPDGATPAAAEPGPVEPSPEAPGPVEPAPSGPLADRSKVDLLLIVDNSGSMGIKQTLLSAQVRELTWQLANPPCVDDDGLVVGFDGDPLDDAAPAECPEGSVRSHVPVEDLHLGVITTSLGGYASDLDCTIAGEGDTDNSHLLRTVLDSSQEAGFYSYCSDGRAAAGACNASTEALTTTADITLAGDRACGWESSLESWYRFLVEPAPWTRIVRQNCPFGDDTEELCNGPELGEDEEPLIDEALLAERQSFLRPDSVLIILLLTDENDCSFQAEGQSWRLAQTFRLNDAGLPASSRAYRASSACADRPNSECCVSCGAAVPQGCPTVMNAEGETVSAGCERPIYESAEDLAAAGSDEKTEDAVNLRCFQQKQRFGVDYLYPVERYTRALSSPTLCPSANTLDPAECEVSQHIANPLFTSRQPGDVIFAGILGAPWQDLATDPTGSAPLVYRSPARSSAEGLDWSWLIGEPLPESGVLAPLDPLMLESIEPRSGSQPSTGAALDDWNIAERDDLQYACTFPIAEPVECPSLDDLGPGITAGCDCTYYGEASYVNPLCRSESGEYGRTQYRDKAYPALRQLQVMYDLSESSVVASICPKETTDTTKEDYGYRPAINAVLRKLGGR
jgi:hypothetical protein